MSKLTILAGPEALRRVRERGLSAADIGMVFGASGAAKWLTIAGLDTAVFSRFLHTTPGPVDLFGTSIGAFKLAACAQDDPVAALARLAHAYIEQRYAGEITPATVSGESVRITQHMLGANGAAEILANPRFRFHCGTVRCLGMLASNNATMQKLAMARAFALATVGRRQMKRAVHRAVFSDPRASGRFGGADGYPTEQHELAAHNFDRALLASGSIPLVMAGVDRLPDDNGTGIYRDGGLLDYHPVPSNLTRKRDKLVLYPHFYPHLVEGWFDKFFASRRVGKAQLDNVILVAPSDEFVATLPGSKIPDRKDFYTFADDDPERQRRWREVVTRSEELGDAFIELVQTGRLAEVIAPL